VTAECAGTEALACSGLAAGDAGNTVIGEGLGMVAVACMGRGVAAGAGTVAEAGLLAEADGAALGADSVAAGSSVSVGGGTDNSVV
jgi:hypothetical protein